MALTQRLTLLFWGSLHICGLASACIFKYGTSPDSLSPPHGGSHWDHGLNGDDWTGVDAAGKPWTCLSGIRQSPINVPTPHSLELKGDTLSTNLRTKWNYPTIYSNGSNVEVINNGHAIQVEWLSPYAADVEIVVPVRQSSSTSVTAVLGMQQGEQSTTVRATPTQFHFHTMSEHLIMGKHYPLELHIVHKITDLPACASGCYSVTGVLFELTDDGDNPLLDSVWAAMPMREGQVNFMPAGAEIRLGEFLPPAKVREYVTYEGSLTTPPCTEGLLWHVMMHPQKISRAQWKKYKTAVSFKDCALKNATSTAGHGHHRHHHRRLLAEEEPAGNPEDYTCTVAAYGFNYRSSQQLYGRAVKYVRVA
ncbi:hypothetical protein Vafri_18441 [Volvox africanus]|uniref:Carbonic anhydrase n=2 Tax=Volvox africanus TaxID=51714 RepID=A0A8J4BSK2_9CHLO|nr:hypothetical protein Vafri_18441 [Volvox africanus]